MPRGPHAAFLAFRIPSGRGAQGAEHRKPPLPDGNGGLECSEGRGSGVGLAAVVGGVALAGAALAGALAHVVLQNGVVGDPRKAPIPTIVAYYRGGE